MDSQLLTIPQDLLREIISHVPLRNLMELCSSDSTIAKICGSDRSLAQVIAIQTGYTTKPNEVSWKEFAILLSKDQIRSVEVIYKNKTVGNIWYWPNKKLAQVEKELLTIYPGNIETLLILFSPSIHLFATLDEYPTQTVVSKYPDPNQSIWSNSDEIKLIDDTKEIDKITPRKCQRCASYNTAITTQSAGYQYRSCFDCGTHAWV